MESSLKAAMLAQPRLLELVPIFVGEGMLAWDDIGLLTDNEMEKDLGMNLGARKAFHNLITEHQSAAGSTKPTFASSGLAAQIEIKSLKDEVALLKKKIEQNKKIKGHIAMIGNRDDKVKQMADEIVAHKATLSQKEVEIKGLRTKLQKSDIRLTHMKKYADFDGLTLDDTDFNILNGLNNLSDSLQPLFKASYAKYMDGDSNGYEDETEKGAKQVIDSKSASGKAAEGIWDALPHIGAKADGINLQTLCNFLLLGYGLQTTNYPIYLNAAFRGLECLEDQGKDDEAELWELAILKLEERILELKDPEVKSTWLTTLLKSVNPELVDLMFGDIEEGTKRINAMIDCKLFNGKFTTKHASKVVLCKADFFKILLASEKIVRLPNVFVLNGLDQGLQDKMMGEVHALSHRRMAVMK